MSAWVDGMVAAVQSRLLRTSRDAAFRPVAVSGEGDGLRITFKWRDDPHLFVVHAPFKDDAQGLPPWALADDMYWWLIEELHTGLVARAARRPSEDAIELHGVAWTYDDHYVITKVPNDGSGAWLTQSGFHTELPLARRSDNLLLAWLQSSPRDASGQTFVGQAVVSWSGLHAARIELVQVSSRAARTVAMDLVHAAMHRAAEAGASVVHISEQTALSTSDLESMGFMVGSYGEMSVTTDFLGAQRV